MPGTKQFLRILFITALLTATGPFAGPAAGGVRNPRPGNHHNSPVFYEIDPVPGFLRENRTLLHANRLKLGFFPVVDVTGWDWRNGGYDDPSWWIQVEELRFLLPLLGTGRTTDHELARQWFRSWYDSHTRFEDSNPARWGDPMTVAYRGMVLVYLLKLEECRQNPDTDLVHLLRDALLTHQEFLADPDHFDADSNHGLVEAFGFLEVTRVYPDQDFEQLGLDRMVQIVDVSLSKQGMHMEHAPAYSFAFLMWVDRYSSYLSGLEHLDVEKVGYLVERARRLRETSWYLSDHDGTIPEIGDTDSMNVFSRYPEYGDVGMGEAPAVLVDPEAGYAIHKGPDRYVVFNIQSVAHDLAYHFHSDALAVYYRLRGETILGDPGKYEYRWTPTRHYFTSMASHNTVVPAGREGLSLGTLFAGRVGSVRGESQNSFSAYLEHDNAFGFARTVRISERDRSLVVADSLHAIESSNTRKPPAKKSRNRRSREKQPSRRGSAGSQTHPQELATGDNDSDRRSGIRRATMVWNFGYDVVAVSKTDTEKDETIAYEIETRRGRKLRFSVSLHADPARESALGTELDRGRESPPAGWYAPKLHTKRPSFMLRVNVDFEAAVDVVTRIDEVGTARFPGLRILIRGY